MKVLIVSQYFWPENFKINDFALGMIERGHEVMVLTGKPNYPGGRFFPHYNFFVKRVEYYKKIKIIRAPLISRGKGTGLRLVLNFLSFALFGSITAMFRIQERFDVIFVYEVSPITVGIPAIILKKRMRIPMFLWVQDLWPETAKFVGNVNNEAVLKCLNILVKYIYKWSDKIFISSRSFAQSVRTKNVDNEKIVYFPNWAEDLYLSSDPDPHKYVGLIPDGFKLLFAGNIGDSQDFGSIIKAAELLRELKNIHWIILGDGRKKEWLISEVKRLKLEDNFHILGGYPPEEMPDFFIHCDAMLVTLKDSEIFRLTVPAKIQSYLAFGKPILAMINGEGAYIIDEANAGLSCNSGDFKQLASNVLRLYNENSNTLKIMGENARKYSETNFSRSLLLDRFEEVFSKLA